MCLNFKLDTTEKEIGKLEDRRKYIRYITKKKKLEITEKSMRPIWDMLEKNQY